MNATDNIHRRYHHIFTLPSTHISVILTYFTAALIAVTVNAVSGAPLSSTILSTTLTLLLLSITVAAEYLFLKTNLLASLKRLCFLSVASNILWLLVLAVGLPLTLRSATMGKHASILILGIFVAVSFRLVIFKPLLNNFHRVVLVSFAQPILTGLAASYPSLLPYFPQQQLAYTGGTIFVAGTVAFMILLDRKGEEYFKEKSFRFLHAFLLAWLADRPDEFERNLEKISSEVTVGTTVSLFEDEASSKPTLIVTDVHPGPFYPVGSSNLPYMLHEWFRNRGYSPMVLHGISEHNLNLPSKGEVRHFLSLLNSLSSVTSTNTCTTPITQNVGKATVTGIAFNDTGLLILTLSPYETEDFPKEVRSQIEKSASSTDFKNIIIVDSHNSQGEKPDANSYTDVCMAAHHVLGQLRTSLQHSFKVGFSHSSEFNFPFKGDVGPAGISVLALEVNGRTRSLVGVDANNAKLGLREALIESSEESDASIIELCTSDTHATINAKGGNHKGYFALGDLTDESTLINAIQTIKNRATDRLTKANLTVKVAKAVVKVMGVEALDGISLGLDKSLSFAKKGAVILLFFFVLILLSVSTL